MEIIIKIGQQIHKINKRISAVSYPYICMHFDFIFFTNELFDSKLFNPYSSFYNQNFWYYSLSNQFFTFCLWY